MDMHDLEKKINTVLVEAQTLGYSFVELGARRVSICPVGSKSFSLQFRDQGFDIANTIHGGDVPRLKFDAAKIAIVVFLDGFRLDDDEDYFDEFINQADRECFVVEDSATPTRLRIQYDMPAAGPTKAWRHHVSFNTYRSEDEIERRTRHRARRSDEHLQTTRYIARLY